VTAPGVSSETIVNEPAPSANQSVSGLASEKFFAPISETPHALVNKLDPTSGATPLTPARRGHNSEAGGWRCPCLCLKPSFL
jgi:hypothetical protein